MLCDKLVRARVQKGWTVNGAAGRTQTVHHFTLRKLESGETDPTKVTASTMIDLLKLYPGDLEIGDFVGSPLGDGLRFHVLRKRGRKPKEKD
jgi:hypothetical protein